MRELLHDEGPHATEAHDTHAQFAQDPLRDVTQSSDRTIRALVERFVISGSRPTSQRRTDLHDTRQGRGRVRCVV